MFKLDKNTHMMVLFTFSLIFIVVYLYYTITDVRKMQREVKRISDELAQLQSKNSTATPPSPVPASPPASNHVPVNVCVKATTNEVTVVDVSDQIKETETVIDQAPQVPAADQVTIDPITQFQDNESVVTEEIRDTLDCTDDEDIDLQNIINSSAPAQDIIESDIKVELDSAELAKMKYEDVKDMCKSKNLSTKGSKDVLIKRLLESK